MALDTTSYAMPVARTIADLRAAIAAWKQAGEIVGFVPTMGALHAGHISLTDVARANGATKVVVSIFVNPTQFGPGEDLDAYPRTEAADAKKLIGKGDLIFAPAASEIYPEGYSTTVSVSGVTQTLEGEARPTHFDGVATVVTKLLLAVLPDNAVFGEKDYQQLLTIRRFVADLHIPVEILAGPILREPDGLAMSSRNVYLSEQERKAAGQLNVILKETADQISGGGDIATCTAEATQRLLDIGFANVDYLTVRYTVSLAPVESLTEDARILVAAKIGTPRLLDNMPVPFKGQIL